MPGFDGTGPNGQGSMTGGGRGRCVTGVDTDAEERFGFGRRSGGRGMGLGRGLRFGRGLRRGRGFGGVR